MEKTSQLERRIRQIKECGLPYIAVLGVRGPVTSIPELTHGHCDDPHLEVAWPEILGYLDGLPETVEIGPHDFFEDTYPELFGHQYQEEERRKFVDCLVRASGGEIDRKTFEEAGELGCETHYVYDGRTGYTHMFLLPTRELWERKLEKRRRRIKSKK